MSTKIIRVTDCAKCGALDELGLIIDNKEICADCVVDEISQLKAERDALKEKLKESE